MSQFAPNPSVYVGNLDPQVNEQILYEHFARSGPVMSVRVCMDSATQKSMGYGYVNFQNPADAEKALDELQSSKLCNRFIRVSKIQRDPSQRRSGVNNIIVKRLPQAIDVPGLKEIFSKFGRISSLNLAMDETGNHRGYAYISFEKEDSAVRAVNETNNLEIDGKQITVERYNVKHREETQKQFTNLYIKNLNSSVDEERLKAFFTSYGEVTSAMIRRDPSGNSMEFGYVAFASHEAAATACEDLNEKESAEIGKEGVALVVRRFQSRIERSRNKERLRRERQLQYSKYPNLYVKHFDETVNSDRLKELFERVGPTVSVRVMIDPASKTSRCFGFVSMRDQNVAMKAIQELNGSTFLSARPLFVTYALKRDARRQALEEMHKKNVRMRQNAPMGGMYPSMNAPPGMGPSAMNPQLFSHPGQLQPQMMRGMPMMAANPMLRPPMAGMGIPRGPLAPTIARAPLTLAKGPMPQMMPPMMPQPAQQQQPAVPPQQQLASLLASMNPEQQKNVLGERLYNYIMRKHPNEAAKVTGMLLEMDNSEILNLLDTTDLLDSKIGEALDVLHRHAGM